MFLPWSYEFRNFFGTVYLGMEIIHLIPLFVITTCSMISSSVLYNVYYYYDSSKAVYFVGFGVGLGGTVLGMVTGIFGIYYFFVGIRNHGVFLYGSALYWSWDALQVIFCTLILVNIRRALTHGVPITHL